MTSGTPQSTAAISSSGLDVNSWQFFGICVLGIVAMRAMRGVAARQMSMVLLNLFMLSYFLRGWDSVLGFVGLLCLTFCLGEIRARFDRSLPRWSLPAIVVAYWVFLFLVKDPALAAPANPFGYVTVQIVGISYLTFRAMNYISDADILERRSFVTFCNYMLFYPTLLMGPIERYDAFSEQFPGRPGDRARVDVLHACHRIANGAIKKFVVADNISVLAEYLTRPGAEVAVPMLWASVLSLLVTLYLDFSGYCDIVLGVASLMGIRILENFDHPFRATNVQEFWTRWHISLTGFITDYVFTPLNRLVLYRAPGALRTWLILLILVFCMMLIALWHGTTWGFVAFGALQGAALVGIQLFRRFGLPRLPESARASFSESRSLRVTSRVVTYVFLTSTMVFWFVGVGSAVHIFERMAGLR